MLETRSAIYKMIEVARDDRQIDNWPPPFLSDITEYNEKDFDTTVRRSCERKDLTLKMAKAIVIGDVSVGKSCLVNRFCHKIFDNNYKATIGVDFEVERWDTAGQERFKSIAASYYRAANVIIVVFDLTNLISLGHCQQWLNEAAKSNTEPYYIFLVGTKRDLLMENKKINCFQSNQVYRIIEKRACEVARKMKAEFWAVSARTGDGITGLFKRAAVLSFHGIIQHELQNMKPKSINIGSDLISKCKGALQQVVVISDGSSISRFVREDHRSRKRIKKSFVECYDGSFSM
ncbi:Ras-related protein Rab-34 [Eufriesea mexicana]|nr:Ras-related protein Rab-34 [Eufriesea mexicana]